MATSNSAVPQKPVEQTAEEIWTVKPGERRSVGVIHIVITALLIGIGFVANIAWLNFAVQPTASIWFGAWGVLTGAISPFFFFYALGGYPLYDSLAYIPAGAIQAFLPAWAFRHYKADPRLKSARDYLILLAAMIVSSAFNVLWWLVVQRGSDALLAEPHLITDWSICSVVNLVFTFILLKALSPVVLRTTAFVKKWWA
ncbi:MAG: hypothetical protein C0393_05395 [Anaerolinea sp.]|nr:hypothetical protein [Anaerolinea sp.]